MGYTTKFAGKLMFARTPTAPELAFVKSLFWIDNKDTETRGLINTKGALSYVQFELTEEFDGVRWDGSEKFYGAVEAVNFIQENLIDKFEGQSLVGEFQAQGEDFDDRWLLLIGPDGWAHKVVVPFTGKKAICPDCGHTFELQP